MKKCILLSCLLLSILFASAQAQDGFVDYAKKPQPAAVIELPYPPNIVTEALNEYLLRKGRSRASDLKGFTTYRNTQEVLNDSSNADLYFRIERKSRKEKETTVVSLMLTKPAENGLASGPLHHLNNEEAKTYLNDLVPAIEAYNLELLIKEQNDVVTKAESRYKNLMEDGDDLEKKRTGIEKKISENKNDIEEQKKTIENQKQKLADWVSQRKS